MPVVKRLTVTSKAVVENLVCPVDQDGFFPGQEVVACPVCGRIYHRKCWAFNDNKCAVLNCAGAGPIESPVPVTTAVLNTATSTLSSLPQKLRLTSKSASLLSWLFTMIIAYLYLTRILKPKPNPISFPRGLMLIIIALFAIAASTSYEIYQQKKHRGWRSEVAHFVSAVVLGFIGLSFADHLTETLLPNLAVELQHVLEPNVLSVALLTMVTGTTIHLGAWNSPTHFSKPVHVTLRILTAISVTALSAIFLLYLLDLLDWNRAIIYPDYPLRFYLFTIVGVAIGSTVNSQLGLWTGTPRSGIRWLIETVITTAVLAMLGIILGHLVWRYVVVDLLAEVGVRFNTANQIYHYATIGWGVLGAAYGSSKQAHSGLTTIFRLTVKLIFVTTTLGVVATGGYIGYAIGREQFGVTDDSYLIGIALVSALITFLILIALYKFLRDIIKS